MFEQEAPVFLPLLMHDSNPAERQKNSQTINNSKGCRQKAHTVCVAEADKTNLTLTNSKKVKAVGGAAMTCAELPTSQSVPVV